MSLTNKFRVILAVGVLFFVAAYSFYTYTHPDVIRIPSDPRNADSVTFFALGDQGTGGLTQWRIAHAMEKVAEKYQALDFVVLLGDNFYSKDKLTINSPEWMSKFENVYTGKYLSGTPFYAVLGNHDHGKSDSEEEKANNTTHQLGGLKEVQVEYSQKHMGSNRWHMPNRYYSADFGKAGDQPLLRVVFLDTNLGHEDMLKQADFIRQQFSEAAHAPIWRFVVGHHPIRTYGRHYGETGEFEEALLPVLQTSMVDVYMSGHDHNQQVIARNNEPYYLVSGGGGAKTYSIKQRPKDLIYAQSANGFLGMRVHSNEINITIYDTSGAVLASFVLNRSCHQDKTSCLKPNGQNKTS